MWLAEQFICKKSFTMTQENVPNKQSTSNDWEMWGINITITIILR